MPGTVLGAKEALVSKTHLQTALKQLNVCLEQWFSILAAHCNGLRDLKSPMPSDPASGQLNQKSVKVGPRHLYFLISLNECVTRES